ncbi:hypothetical protein [Planobispora takensis]|uniref:hypothetical protein n=1 Tax=Planobispora takensis TaxID=1367882 RepID=UPI0019445776|nr:hypothetical protein [Planobispora takensis]
MSSKSRQTKAQHQQREQGTPVRKGPGPVTSAQLRQEKGAGGRGAAAGRAAAQSPPVRHEKRMSANRQA